MGSSNLTRTCRTCVTLPCGETLTVRAASARCVALKKPIASNETAAADASVQVRFFMTLIIECAPGCPKPLAILPERYVNLTICFHRATRFDDCLHRMLVAACRCYAAMWRRLTRRQYRNSPIPATPRLSEFATQKPRAPCSHGGANPPTS